MILLNILHIICFQGPLIATAFTNGYHWTLKWRCGTNSLKVCTFFQWLKHTFKVTNVCVFSVLYCVSSVLNHQSSPGGPGEMAGVSDWFMYSWCHKDFKHYRFWLVKGQGGVEPNKEDKKNAIISENETSQLLLTVIQPSCHCRTPFLFYFFPFLYAF